MTTRGRERDRRAPDSGSGAPAGFGGEIRESRTQDRNGFSNRAQGSTSTLSERERRFVELYMGAAGGNATKAARLAGYAKSTAEKQASRLLGKVGVRQAIEARAESDPAVWTRENRQRFWTAVASGAPGFESATLRDRLKASELLGRSQADFIERVEHSGQVTLEQVLTASRATPPEPARV